ncbi:unnamed protein product [Lactuca virosa]|uniref:Pre-mRNA-splicing factor SLU7 n=1 Tax=Lactuca virosa TaxID=75947 RepID=A0AAU9NSN0_9ASTR|nr:unnamed protein product [Lactuca virosa]
MLSSLTRRFPATTIGLLVHHLSHLTRGLMSKRQEYMEWPEDVLPEQLTTTPLSYSTMANKHLSIISQKRCSFFLISWEIFISGYITSSLAFKSREDHRKQMELEEARKAGLAPVEVDEDGKEINPHIPQYMSSAPWYLNAERPSLKHQRKWNSDPNYTKSWYDRGAKIYQADKYRKGACENYETHNQDMHGEATWNGYDATYYAHVIERYEARDEARKKFLKDQQLKKLEEKGNTQNVEEAVSDDEDNEDALKVDEAKVDESKQMDFANVEKRVRTTGGGSTGTIRNLRIREDTTKYLLNLDVNSAHYDLKTRSMREDPLPDMDPNEKFYAGDNQNRLLLHKLNCCIRIVEKYGNVAADEALPRELLLGQSEREVEYDRAGRIIKGQKSIASNKDPESSKKHEDIKQPSLLPLQEKLSGNWFSQFHGIEWELESNSILIFLLDARYQTMEKHNHYHYHQKPPPVAQPPPPEVEVEVVAGRKEMKRHN